MTDDLIREVTDAVQREQLFGAAKRYGVVIAVITGLGAAAAGGWWFFQQRHSEGKQLVTSQLMEGREQFIAKKYDKAEAILTPLTQADKPNREVATLWLVKTQLAAGKKDAAIESLAKAMPAAGAKTANPLYANLLCLQAQWLAAGDTRFAACQTNTNDAAFLTLQKEALAVQNIAAGDYDAAQSALPQDNMTQGENRRIADMKAYLAARTAKPEAAKTEPGKKESHAQ